MGYQVLQSELTADPLGRSYDAMTDQQAANSLNAQDRTRQRETLSASEIFEAIVIAEWKALTDPQKQQMNTVLGLGDAIRVGLGTKARDFILDAFGAGTTTRTNLGTVVSESISRGAEIGWGRVKPGEVGGARG